MLPFPSMLIGQQATAVGSGPSPTLVATGSFVHNASGTSPVDVPYPAGIAGNDIAILFVTKTDSSNAATVDTPSGWTLLHNRQTGSTAHCTTIFWKRLTGSESGSVTVTSPNTGAADTHAGIMAAWRGCLTSGNPYEDAQSTLGTDSSAESPATTTTGPNRTLVRCVVDSGSSVTPSAITPASGWTEISDDLAPNATYDVRMEMASRTQAAAGTFASDTTTVDASTDQGWVIVQFALLPA